ncbi:di-heme oxidoredictase family protein [Hyalangium minutum]|uniref:Putative thiol oxidoreductase with 2 cytochrome c heme-binding site n=1 Tax=Hyalangium minutum TaxID=394096 RepID=A0A085WAA4_9BACT|nr:di-heme oxidoredictase family protein [Hyalangium minutum]KFE64617.1 putative thiol oxidoreductase with 2 cytochrome c heme-binding site [Hyalangium minutum]
MRQAMTLGAVVALLSGCGDSEPPRAGGATTIDDRTSLAFAQPAPNLTPEQLTLHRVGDSAFAAVFVPGMAPVNPGLGPLYNNTSCNGCHLRNGRGMPVMGTGPQRTQLLVRVSLPSGTLNHPNGAVPVPGLGIQIADQAVYGYTPEASVALSWEESSGTYGDGAAFSLRSPRIQITPSDGSSLPPDLLTSLRLPPPVFGLGLLEAVPTSTLRAMEDPNDKNGDGISGRLNEVWDVQAQALAPGRFGLKANSPNLLQQSAEAYVNDMGVTNPLFPEPDGTHDLSRTTLEAAAFYAQSLGVPARTALDNADVQEGEKLFRSAGCESCHRETLETGDHPLPELAHERIHPYTDLLLHDMGPGLADGRPDGVADGNEWRTAPLWGVGLTQTVLPYAGYLHDGRARTLEEAILWHGGEAERSRERFRAMSAPDREALVKFLGSL